MARILGRSMSIDSLDLVFDGLRPGDVEAVILDRDGVINENRTDHVKTWDEFQFLPGAATAVADLCQAGLRVFVMTNQAIINRGIATRETVDDLNWRMVSEIRRCGGSIEAVACCPHRPDQGCQCRKPQPGLLIDLASRFGIDLTRSLVIGDALTDIEAGLAAGCSAILVLTGRGHEQLAGASASIRHRFGVAPDLCAIARWLLLQRTSTPDLEAGHSGC
jgi:D-glycero-D-manno-heptose 1,7-bisphosphate phosphatase